MLRVVEVTLEAAIPSGFDQSGGMSVEAILVGVSSSTNPIRVTMHTAAPRLLRGRASIPAKSYNAYIGMRCKQGYLACTMNTGELAQGARVQFMLSLCESVRFHVTGAITPGTTIGYSPAGFLAPVHSARILADGLVVVEGIPDGLGVDVFGLTADQRTEAAEGKRTITVR